MKARTRINRQALLKRQKVLTAVAEGKSLQEAGEIAGYKKNSAKDLASRAMNHPINKIKFKELLEEIVPDRRLTDKYGELLEATKVISATVAGANGMAEANATSKDFIEVPDYPTQLKTADSISKLKGHMIEGNQTNIQINFDKLTDRQLREMAEGRMPKELE